jgi:hypothetical protein
MSTPRKELGTTPFPTIDFRAWILDDNTNVIDNNGDISRLNIDVDTKKGTRDHSQINALL